MHRTPLLLALALATACTSTYVPTDNTRFLNAPLWDATTPTAAGGELFIRLPHAGGVARLAPGTEPVITVDAARPVRDVVASPDGSHVLARSEAIRCEPEEGPVPTRLADCLQADRMRTGFLEVLAPAGADTPIEAEPWYTDVQFSPDGRFAVSPIDPDADTSGGGVVSLTSVLVVDLDAGTSTTVSVGFQATRVLFTTGTDGATTGMVVLSRSEVAVVDLTSAVPVPGVTYPLTLDNTQTVSPSDVALTPDEAYALITVADSSDLYILDLTDPSINLVALSAAPTTMSVDVAHDQTLFVYENRSVVDVLDHGLFDLSTVSLDAPATRIAYSGDFALLSAPNRNSDVVRLDLATLRTDTYRLTWQPERVDLAPSGDFAIALGLDGGQGRMEVLDLREIDGRVDTSTKPFALQGPGVDVAFAGTGDTTRVLLLQKGVETLYDLTWPGLQVSSLELPAAPVAVGALDDQTFWITHDDGLGLVSFLTDGTLETFGGFAATGFLNENEVYIDAETN